MTAENMRMAILRVLFLGCDHILWPKENGDWVTLIEDGILNREPDSMIETVREELRLLEEINVFEDPYADWMFGSGVIEKKLLNIQHLHDAALIHTAAVLYSKLLLMYPLWLDMTRVPRPGAVTPAEFSVPEQVPKSESEPESESESDRQANLVNMVTRRFNFKKGAEITADELAAELHKREMAMRRGTA